MNNIKYALEVVGATKSFNGARVLDQFTLSLKQGEWLGLVGPNGAGKTTLIRALCGRVKLDQGEIRIRGEKLDRQSSKMLTRCVGIIPQSIALFPLLTVVENFRVFGALNGLKNTQLQMAVEWALEWTCLTEHKDKMVRTLSGGMARRANIACGLIHRPNIILFDEPTVGVDAESYVQIVHMFDELRREGASFLFSTHRLDEAKKKCDRIAIIDRGKLLICGTPDELVAQVMGSEHRLLIKLESIDGNVCKLGQFEVKGNELITQIRDINSDLLTVIEEIHAAGARITDIKIERASLESTLLQLTKHKALP